MLNNNIEKLNILRHSIAHVLAAAILEIDKKAQFAIGPAIDNGFYYDIKSERIFSITDLEMIEIKMREIINRNIPFEKSIIPNSKAIDIFNELNQPFKVELIDAIPDNDVTIYKLGDFTDLCRGPHISNTSEISLNAFKLTSVAGAYWRGDSKNQMLQRIYGIAFFDKKDLDNYLELLKAAEARDHRKLGVELEIFHIDEAAPGSIFWLKNGTTLFELVKNYLVSVIKKHGYYLVQTPQLLNKSLWETSGHWKQFKDHMFISNSAETTMAIKPMNCPGHIIIYKMGAVKSYRDLPIRIAEFGLCHRNEPSGSLHGLMRVRAFTQDDGHIFCTAEQIVSEIINFYKTLQEVYATFEFTDISIKFSNRPEKRAGSDEVWDIAEKSLIEATNALGVSYAINKGEGAFYGPKLEFILKDSIGREWQCGTLQIDFILPTLFGIYYIDHCGKRQTPVLIHRALVGSLERFIGILIENYCGKFPFWLSPVQIAIATVTEESKEYAKKIDLLLQTAGFRTVLNLENEKIT
ncbi:MAG: threonine--tRNA ligase [Holosporales bacterium]|nr:threonine--tRNA ligase [Holosporales bacterium]